jgi:hypothetical protein
MKRSKFSLSHYKLATLPMGKLVPLTWYEGLPGDTLQHATSVLLRTSPLLAPVMHPCFVRIHHWFVPNRLIWDDWEDFITGGPDGTSVPVHPYITINNAAAGSLADYCGVPTGVASNRNVSALPFRAYAHIFNSFYRDQDLVSEVGMGTASGADTTTAVTAGGVRRVSWEKDYMTTMRTDTSKGNTVTIPIGDKAPVGISGSTGGNALQIQNAYTNWRTMDASAADLQSDTGTGSSDYQLQADLSAATGIEINDLRLALAIQRYQENRQRYGSRYAEYLRFSAGIINQDSRLQEPEYLGGGRSTISFSEVLSTDGANTGQMKGHGITAIRTNRYRKFIPEHGIVMTLMSIVPKAMYLQGIPRHFLRTTKEDYFQKELQNLGEQEVTNKELYSIHGTPDGTLGYQARYDEYRGFSHYNNVAGDFRVTGAYDHWHMARIFSSAPSLNSSFIECTPTDRIYASTTYDPILVMANHSIQARRQISKVAKPRTF